MQNQWQQNFFDVWRWVLFNMLRLLCRNFTICTTEFKVKKLKNQENRLMLAVDPILTRPNAFTLITFKNMFYLNKLHLNVIIVMISGPKTWHMFFH